MFSRSLQGWVYIAGILCFFAGMSTVAVATEFDVSGQGDTKRWIQPLNGTWEAAEGDMDTTPTAWERTVPVPGFMDMAKPAFDGVGCVTKPHAEREEEQSTLEPDPRREAFWLKRTFVVEGELPAVARLKIGKAKYGTTVWLNGKPLGTHWPNFTPGYFDVGEVLKGHGQTNELMVRLGASPLATQGKSHMGRDFEKYRYLPGIYDDVSLILTGAPYIEKVQVAPQLDTDSVRVVAWLRNHSSNEVQDTVSFSVTPYGETDTKGTARQRVVVMSAEEKQIEVTIPIADCQRWSPEHPNLYTLHIETAGDSLDVRFGMRSFSFDPETKMPLLNGQPYPMLGSNVCFFRFAEDPARENKPWDEAWVRKLHRQFKSMNWNTLRYCIGFPPEMWYRIADEDGFLIQDEFPIWTLSTPLITPTEALIQEYTAWMEEHWNYPCVVLWDAQNESVQPKAVQTGEALRAVRHLDLSNRPWDNGWGNPQAPLDTYELHHYPMRPFMLPGRLKAQDYDRGLQRGLDWVQRHLDKQEHPVILNEYAWLWVDRAGGSTVLTQPGYDVLYPKGDAEQRFEHYALNTANLTEYYRSLNRVAGILHFCGLSHSIAGCYTSDNFQDLDTLEYEPHFAQYVPSAFAPISLMIDWWEREVESVRSPSVEVVLINDTPHDWRGVVRFQVMRDGNVVSEEEMTTSCASFQRHRLAFTIKKFRQPGHYTLQAALEGVGGKSVTSTRKFRIANYE